MPRIARYFGGTLGLLAVLVVTIKSIKDSLDPSAAMMTVVGWMMVFSLVGVVLGWIAESVLVGAVMQQMQQQIDEAEGSTNAAEGRATA